MTTSKARRKAKGRYCYCVVYMDGGYDRIYNFRPLSKTRAKAIVRLLKDSQPAIFRLVRVRRGGK